MEIRGAWEELREDNHLLPVASSICKNEFRTNVKKENYKLLTHTPLEYVSKRSLKISREDDPKDQMECQVLLKEIERMG